MNMGNRDGEGEPVETGCTESQTCVSDDTAHN